MKPIFSKPRRLGSGALVFSTALLARLIVVGWAWSKVLPTADGKFYHVVAERIAQGHGYTWLWPDGAITYAAHYPVGYPLLMGGLYAVWGPHFQIVMMQNALLGALGVFAAYRVCKEQLAARFGALQASKMSLWMGLLFALSPSLVFYTPALMTEGEVAALSMISVWLVLLVRRRPSWLLQCLLMASLGYQVLLRPQTVLILPVFAWFAVSKTQKPLASLLRAALFAVGALLVVAPWTLRNCERMERCVFVSANGGWNLLIGTFPEGNGAWLPLEGQRIPEECREVYQEASKDQCFGEAGRRRILNEPVSWIRLIPQKLRATFDYASPAADHLAEAGALRPSAVTWLRWSEYVWQRAIAALALLGAALLARDTSQRKTLVGIMAAGGAVCFFLPAAWIGWLVLLFLLVWAGGALRDAPLAVAAASALATVVVHAAFFGAGRYALPAILTLAPLSAYGLAYIGGRFRSSSACAQPGGGGQSR